LDQQGPRAQLGFLDLLDHKELLDLLGNQDLQDLLEVREPLGHLGVLDHQDRWVSPGLVVSKDP